jgi:hypothetical protein
MTAPRQTRFVILHHRTEPGEHWDLLLEADGCFHTWRLERCPTPHAADYPVAATRIFDHPLRFWDYEGPLRSRRGSVTRVCRGTCTISEEPPRGREPGVSGEPTERDIVEEPAEADEAVVRAPVIQVILSLPVDTPGADAPLDPPADARTITWRLEHLGDDSWRLSLRSR